MATYFATDSITNASSFIQQLDEARVSIQLVFRDLMEKLQQREAELLKQLEDIKNEHELNSQETQEALNALKSQRESAHNLKLNKFKVFQQQHVEQLNQMISKLEMEDGKERRISWSWDGQLIEAISALGNLEVRAVDYKHKVKPVISKGRDGSNDGDLKDHWGVAVEMNTGNIYIADSGNHCVKVFTSNGDFLFKFGGDEKLYYPRNICINSERLHISQDHGVVIFNVSGHFLHRFCTEGNNNERFLFPCGIAISSLNSDIYICVCANHRVQIYDSKEFKYKSTMGKDELNHPLDIKFAHNELYILDEQNPCLHVYTTEHVYVRSIISKGPAKQIYFSFCLCIFTNREELLHQIGSGESSDMYQPLGVTIDKDGRIIIVNSNIEANLLIYQSFT